MGANQGVFVPAFSGGIPPVPPSQVRIGKMLVVSTLGSATPARQDLVYHYLTLQAAINAAQSGDIVIVYPGAWTITTLVELTGGTELNIHIMPGATVASAGSVGLFKLTEGTLRITGSGAFTNASAAPIFEMAGGNTILELECDSLLSSNHCIKIGAGKSILNIKDFCITTSNALVAVKISSDISTMLVDAFFNYLGHYDTVNITGDDPGALQIYAAGNNDTLIQIRFNKIFARSRVEAVQLQVELGKLYLKGNLIQNGNTGVTTNSHAIRTVSFITQNQVVEANLQAPGDGCGFYMAPIGNASEPTGEFNQFRFTGDILTISGPALLLQGNTLNEYHFEGIFTSDTTVVQFGDTINQGDVSGRNLKAYVNGRIVSTSVSSSNVMVAIDVDNATEPALLTLNASAYNLGVDGFSIASINEDTAVNLIHFVSNVPTDPGSIIEQITDSIINPLFK